MVNVGSDLGDAGSPAGDPAPQTDGELYERCSAEWIRFAATLVGPSGAEDLLATAVLQSLRADGWRDVVNKRAYVYRVMVNEAHKHRRSISRRLAREARVAASEAVEADSGVDPTVLNALRRLTARQRAVIHLTYWADLDPDGVAGVVGVSRRTVERELTEARSRLGRWLS